MRLLIMLIVWMAVGSGSSFAEEKSGKILGRSNIYVFKYTSDPKNSHRANEFFDIIQYKIFNLSEEPGISDEAKAIVSKIKIQQVKNSGDETWKSPRNMTPNKLMRFWEESGALQLFFGRIFERDDTYYARTSVHFGKLSHGLPRNGYRMNIPLTQEQYDITQDSHSAVIMYALTLIQLGMMNGSTSMNCVEPRISRELILLAKNFAMDAAKGNPEIKVLEEAINEVAVSFGKNCK